MPLIAGAVIGGVGLGSQIIGGQQQKKEARQLADKQQYFAEQTLQGQREFQQKLLGAAQPSQNEIDILNAALSNIQRERSLLESIDPTIKSAAEQANRLLAGNEVSALAPFREEQARQRESVVSQLRAQLGPGAETSSAGVEALALFDQKARLANAQVQQNALNALLQTTVAGTPNVNASINTAGQLAENQQSRLLRGYLGSGPTDYSPLIAAANAQYQARSLASKNLQGLGSQLTQIGGSVAGQGMAMNAQAAQQQQQPQYDQNGRMILPKNNQYFSPGFTPA